MSTPKDIAAPYMHLIREALAEVRKLINQARGVARNGETIQAAEAKIDQALEALSKIPPALSVVEAGNVMASFLRAKSEGLAWRDTFPHWQNMIACWDLALSQGEAVQKDGGFIPHLTDEELQYMQDAEGDRLKTGAGPSAAISPKTERISAPVPVAPTHIAQLCDEADRNLELAGRRVQDAVDGINAGRSKDWTVSAVWLIDAKISMARSHTAVAVAEARKAGLLPSPPSPPTAQKP